MADVKESYDQDGKLKITITSDKRKSHFTVQRSNDGFTFFEVLISKGKLPEVLEGLYSTPFLARDAVLEYLRNYKTTAYVHRDNRYKDKDDSTVLSEGV